MARSRWEYLTVGIHGIGSLAQQCGVGAAERIGRAGTEWAVRGRSPGKSLSLPSPDEVRAQLARILGSPEFVVPERARSFLRYLVEQTLAGRADRLKGYTIATAVFERDASFDSQADPVVRTEAGRLRRALERYYLVAGQADPVLIEVPKGGYVPIFSRRAAPAPEPPAAEAQPAAAGQHADLPGAARWRAATVILAGLAALAAVLGLQQMRHARATRGHRRVGAPGQPTLLVMPFASLGEGDEATLYAAGVTEEILTKLSRFKDLAVLGGKTAPSAPATADPRAIARELAARYVVTGSLRLSGPEMRVTSRLVDTRTGTVLWAQTYRGKPGCQGAVRDPGGHRAAGVHRRGPALRARLPVGAAADGRPAAR